MSAATLPRFGNEIQDALIRTGHRMTVHEVRALHELDEAFRAWAADRERTIVWDAERRLAEAIAAVLHIELTWGDDDDA